MRFSELLKSKEEEIIEKLKEANKEAMLNTSIQITVYIDEDGTLSDLTDVNGGNSFYAGEYAIHTFSYHDDVTAWIEPDDCLEALHDILERTDKETAEKFSEFAETFKTAYEEENGIPENIREKKDYSGELWTSVKDNPYFSDGIMLMEKEMVEEANSNAYELFQNILEVAIDKAQLSELEEQQNIEKYGW